MPFIPATNVVQAELIFSWDGQIVENVLHYQVAGGVDSAAMVGIGGGLVEWFEDVHKPQVPPTVTLNEVRMTDLTSEFAPGLSWTGGLPQVGTDTGTALPNNVTLSITKRTLFRGRAYRGRIYHIGLTEADVTNNIVNPAQVTTLLASYEQMRTLPIGVGTFPMVVISRYQGSEPRAAALVTLVESFSSDGVIDSQRRRLPKRGS